jgi:hypothetical protein
MSDLFPVSLVDQIAEVEREIRMREEVYRRQIVAGRMTKARADAYLARMRAVLTTLQILHGDGSVP